MILQVTYNRKKLYLPKGGWVSFLSPSHFRQLRSFPIFLLNESLLTSLERAESLTLNRFDPFTVKSWPRIGTFSHFQTCIWFWNRKKMEHCFKLITGIIFDGGSIVEHNLVKLAFLRKCLFGYINVGDGCWRQNVLATIFGWTTDVGDGFGRFCHQHPLPFNISVGHLSPITTCHQCLRCLLFRKLREEYPWQIDVGDIFMFVAWMVTSLRCW